mmetsp:Transcript_14113/g.53033  ORF Transcript_14113/g.53033 Transcript_14113/m.53033 type:complete len:124 (-) Transcript_14113:1779-2150(-)
MRGFVSPRVTASLPFTFPLSPAALIAPQDEASVILCLPKATFVRSRNKKMRKKEDGDSFLLPVLYAANIQSFEHISGRKQLPNPGVSPQQEGKNPKTTSPPPKPKTRVKELVALHTFSHLRRR